MKLKYKTILYCTLTALLIILDMLTKIYLDGKNITLINGVLSFLSSHNTGAGFSILSNKTLFLIIITSVFLVIFTLFNMFEKFKLSHLYLTSIALIYAGAIGNLIDRLMFGYVRDFIYFELIDFPIFNVADICLTVGVTLYAINFLFFNKNKKEQNNAI